jgi:peptide/nickel transport system substrate-binding protein
VREAVLEPRDCSAISEKEQATARFAIVSAGCTEAAAGPSYRVARRPGLYVKYLAMDFVHARTTAHAANPFLDLRVRQAISLAVDRERLVQELGRPARAANQPVPLTVLGFDPTLAPFPADAGRARELLAQAGFPQGFEAPLLVRAVLRQGIERIQADLAAIGVRVRLSVIEDAAFGDAIARGESHLWLTRFACAGGDASDLFQAFFGSRHRLAAIHGGYDSPAMEKDFEALNRLEGVRARRDALQALLRRLMAELPIVPLYSDEDVYLIRQDVRWEPRNDAYLRLADVAAP